MNEQLRGSYACSGPALRCSRLASASSCIIVPLFSTLLRALVALDVLALLTLLILRRFLHVDVSTSISSVVASKSSSSRVCLESRLVSSCLRRSSSFAVSWNICHANEKETRTARGHITEKTYSYFLKISSTSKIILFLFINICKQFGFSRIKNV